MEKVIVERCIVELGIPFQQIGASRCINACVLVKGQQLVHICRIGFAHVAVKCHNACHLMEGDAIPFCLFGGCDACR